MSPFWRNVSRMQIAWDAGGLGKHHEAWEWNPDVGTLDGRVSDVNLLFLAVCADAAVIDTNVHYGVFEVKKRPSGEPLIALGEMTHPIPRTWNYSKEGNAGLVESLVEWHDPTGGHDPVGPYCQ